MSKRLEKMYQDIEERLEKLGAEFICFDYSGKYKLITYIGKCGCISTSASSTIYSNNSGFCSECHNAEKIVQKDIEYHKILKDNGYEVVDNTIMYNIQVKVKCINKDGYYVYVSIGTIRNHINPTIFGDGNPWYYENREKLFASRGCKLLWCEGQNIETRVKYIASCGHVVEEGFYNFLHKDIYTCKKCHPTMLNRKGGYNFVIAERNKSEWLNEKAYVYVMHFYNDEVSFYKIGISTNPKSRRSHLLINGYEIDILYTIETNKYDATYIENSLHSIHSKYSYMPKFKRRDGHTECFSYIHFGIIERMVKND